MKRTWLNRITLALTLASSAIFSASVTRAQDEASLNSFYTPSYRGQANTESALWDDASSNTDPSTPAGFTNPYNAPNYAYFAASGGSALANASVTQTTDGGGSTFIIPYNPDGSGDIYSYGAVNTFVLSYSGAFAVGNVIFQTETTGSTLDFSSVQLTYTLAGNPQTLSATPDLLYNNVGDSGFGEGADQVTAWGWNLPLGDDVTSFSIAFNGAGTSVGLERTMLDVAGFNSTVPVPEPSSMALAGVGGLGLLLFGRRFRRQSC
ncbi:MAG TPA: PEP-CTERM sorting domain-containing protein [Verrucomicrobiae bacterium]|nr:PEP-CTERM sorting domain-containing protein [Verrucomicrobiae bacterium]